MLTSEAPLRRALCLTPAPLVALLLVACGSPDTMGHDAARDATRTDATQNDVTGFDSATDTPVTPDAPTADGPATPDVSDVADAPPGPCASNADCATSSAGHVCDTTSGRCVECVSASDTCPADQHCVDATHACAPGCRSDEGCASAGGGGDAGTDGAAGGDGGVPRARCDTASHTCVQCTTSDHCPAGTLCMGNQCVTGCTTERPCPTGQTCCTGACVDTQTNTANCGGCGTACAVPHAAAGCASGACTVASCTAPFGDCDGMAANGCETDTSSSAANCGACGTACPARPNGTPTCAAGACGVACNPGFADCDGDASNGCEVNLNTSPAHCGACTTTCAVPNATAACATGICGVGTCNPGFGDCNAIAADGCETSTATNVANCGACGMACPARANSTPTCTGGACGVACNPGFADCDGNPVNGCEVDLGSNPAHCGACATACAYANAAGVCTGGACSLGACNPGFADCDGVAADGCEVDTRTDRTNCGTCGRFCSYPFASGVCSAGACSLGACIAGFGNCDGMPANGCETDLNNNTFSCGSCGNVCSFPNASALCSMGVCAIGPCAGGFANCDGAAANGCEANLNTSVANCGMCGRACSFANAGATCAAGTCGLGACNPGFANCDGAAANGCEVNTNTSVANCGGCGSVCAPANVTAASCTGGACGFTACAAGFGNCDGVAANGCETNLNTTSTSCGGCGVACGAGRTCSGGTCVVANDLCAGATPIALTGPMVTVTGSTVGTTNQSGCGTGGDVYYSFTLAQREVVMVDTFGSGYDTFVGLATSCTGTTACNDDASSSNGTFCGVGPSMVTQVLNAGTYYVVVSGFSGATGAFTLHLHHLPTGNGAPLVLAQGAGQIANGTTAGTGTVSGSCVSSTSPEVMYYFTTCGAYAGGAFSANTCAVTTYDSVVYFVQTNVAGDVCDDDGCGSTGLQSTMSGTASAGAALRAVYVDGYGGAAGAYRLTTTMP